LRNIFAEKLCEFFANDFCRSPTFVIADRRGHALTAHGRFMRIAFPLFARYVPALFLV
jgi:hypothetical protein